MEPCIMVVGAHADDVELNTGGTLLKYRARGYRVIYVMSTNNMSGILSERSQDGVITQTRLGTVPTMQRRKSECQAAASALDAVLIHLDHPQRHYNTGIGREALELRYGCALPEGVLPDVPSILTANEDEKSLDALSELIVRHDPECIFTHGVAQRNIEHYATSLLTANSFWRAVENGYQGALFHWVEGHSFLGDRHLQWETHVDIGGWMDKKLDLIALHRCQMPDPYRPDFPVTVRNKAWGTACGCAAAEVFTVVQRGRRRTKYGSVYGALEIELINNMKL